MFMLAIRLYLWHEEAAFHAVRTIGEAPLVTGSQTSAQDTYGLRLLSE
jgi:hypothetical protein